MVIKVNTDLSNALQQCVDECLTSFLPSVSRASQTLTLYPPVSSRCGLWLRWCRPTRRQPPSDDLTWVWHTQITGRLILTLTSCVVIGSGAEIVSVLRLNTERRNAARTSRLYDNSIMTTAAGWSTLILWGSLSQFSTWRLDFRGGGCGWWHHEVSRKRQSRGDVTTAFLKSWESFNSKPSNKTDRWAAARSRWRMWHGRIKLEQKGKLISWSDRSQSSIFSGSAGV